MYPMMQLKLTVVQKGRNNLLLSFTDPIDDSLVAQGEFTYDGRPESIGRLVRAILKDIMRMYKGVDNAHKEGDWDSDGLDDDDDDDDNFGIIGIPLNGGE